MTTSTLARPTTAIADLVALTKPRLTGLVLFTTAGAFLLAPGDIDFVRLAWTLIGTWLTVASSHALNMFHERDVDGLMQRTKDRPLPAGRMAPEVALVFGVSLGLIGIPLLVKTVGPLAAGLASLALASYVLAYTPLKRRSPAALYVGALPGAIPPVLGWAAATGTLDPAPMALFATMFVWQIPHFLGLSLLLSDDYRSAGIRTQSVVSGFAATQRTTRIGVALLLPVSLSVLLTGVAGVLYAVVAPAMGVAFLAVCLRRAAPDDPQGAAWGRTVFLTSLVHLTALFSALALDALLR